MKKLACKRADLVSFLPDVFNKDKRIDFVVLFQYKSVYNSNGHIQILLDKNGCSDTNLPSYEETSDSGNDTTLVSLLRSLQHVLSRYPNLCLIYVCSLMKLACSSICTNVALRASIRKAVPSFRNPMQLSSEL